MILVFLIYFYYLQLLLHILYFAAGCPLSYRQLRAANGKNPMLWYKSRKVLLFKTFSIYYYIRLDTIGQEKIQAALQFFWRLKCLCYEITQQRIKTPKRFAEL